jgi:type IV pilus assembly protein PilA
MKQLQKGFTLIELMIVVAIIGILAAVAIPSYQDYTARAQVSEAMSLNSGMKTALSEFFADQGRFPTGPASVSNTLNGKYVSTITFANQAGGTVNVDATLRTTGVAQAVQGKIFSVGTTSGGIRWSCGTLPGMQAAATTTLDSKYVPGACK